MAESKDIKHLFNERFTKLIGENTKQKDVAEKIGTTRQTVSNWLSGNAVPDMYALVKIATAYKVSVDYLLGLTDQPSNDKDLASAADYLGISDKTAECLRAGKSYLENAIMNAFIIDFMDILPELAKWQNEIIKRLFYEKYIILFVAQRHNIEVTADEIEDDGMDAIKQKLGKNSPEWAAFKKDCENRIRDYIKEGIFAIPNDIDYYKYLRKNQIDNTFNNICKEMMKTDIFRRYDDFFKALLEWFQNNDPDQSIYTWQPRQIQGFLEKCLTDQVVPNKWQLSSDFLNDVDYNYQQISNIQPKKAGE